jgi:co-chaperonin GroES (HSP10)
MKAIGRNLVILPKKFGTEKTKGGLILNTKDREDIRYRLATVVSVGESIESVKEGQEIYYDRHAGHGIELDKEKYRVIKEQDVVVVL